MPDNEEFNLPVFYKEEELLFSSQLLILGYTHKFVVDVDGNEIIFEPDEERNYRAVVDVAKINPKLVDTELLKAISDALSGLTK